PIGGARVSHTATLSTGNTHARATDPTDPTTGVLTATFSSTTTGGKTISATINTVAITQTAGVTVTAGAVSATTSTVTAAPASIPAGGSSTMTVTAGRAGSNPIGGAARGQAPTRGHGHPTSLDCRSPAEKNDAR